MTRCVFLFAFLSLLGAAACGGNDSGLIPGDLCTLEYPVTLPAGAPSPFFGQCIDQTPLHDPTGDVSCVVLDLRPAGSACACDATQGFMSVRAEVEILVPAGTGCACEVREVDAIPGDGEACRTLSNPVGTDGTPLDGWCYIDPTTSPPTADPNLTGHCPAAASHLVRLVGAPAMSGAADRKLLVACGVLPTTTCPAGHVDAREMQP